MFLKLAVSLLVLVLADEFVQGKPFWKSLRATWSANLLNPLGFSRLPRREAKARSQGWTKIEGPCSGKFLGTRYIKGNDPAVVLLYDVNGFIAGVQNGIPKRDVDALDTSFSYSDSPAYVLDVVGNEPVYFLTAYFVDLNSICNDGRTAKEFKEQGTGTGLYLQNSTNPVRGVVHVPMYEPGVNVTSWVKGACFPTMGVHYWYGISATTECERMFPFNVMYYKGILTNFAFVNFGRFEYSKRLEHLPQHALGRFLPTPYPECIDREYKRSGGFSSIHIFLGVLPCNIHC